MERRFFNGLIWKISVIIILIESVILALTGTYYTNRFSREIDKRIENRIKIPGSLMNRQQLTYKSVSDRDIMTELVGEEFADGIVFGADKKVFYALNSDHIGKTVADIPNIDRGWIDKEITEPKFLKLSDRGDTYLISMTPLTAYKDAQPFFFVYIKVNTSRSEAQKTAIAGFFIASSVFCVALTSLLIIGFIHIFVIKPLGNLERNADMLAQGDLGQAIRINRKDELGSLARSFRYMRDAISRKIAQLEELNRTLEEKIEERTKELGERCEELRESRESLNRILNGMFEGLIVINQDFKIIDVNHRFLELYNGTRDQIIGRTCHEITHNSPTPCNNSDCSCPVKEVFETGCRTSAEHRHFDSQGCETVIEINAVPLLTPAGKVENVAEFIRDITERKQAEEALRESRESYYRLFNEMIDGFALHEIICDDEGKPVDYRFIDVNPAFERLTGLKRENLQNKTVLEVLPGTESIWIEKYGHVALTGEPIHFKDFPKN